MNHPIPFATCWEVRGFLANPGIKIAVGPLGENEITLQFCGSDMPSQFVTSDEPDLIFAKCRIIPTSDQLALLNEIESHVHSYANEGELNGFKMSREKRKTDHQNDIATSSLLQDFHRNIRAPLRDLNKQVSCITQRECLRFMRMLRWRCVQDSDFVVNSRSSIYWQSPTDSNWRRVPSAPDKPGGFTRLQVGISSWEFVNEEVDQRLKNGESVGIHYDLICQANSLAQTMPHLSLYEAVHALEIGVRAAIGQLCLDAKWMADKFPFLPLPKILKMYIPTLMKEEEKPFYEAFMNKNSKRLDEVLDDLNELALKGQPVAPDVALNACALVGEILYKLDYSCGVGWARAAVWKRNLLSGS